MAGTQPKIKKKPERRCAGCGEHRPKSELIRVVRAPNTGEVSLDFTGKKSGRGGYICKSLSCLKKARRARRFESSLEVQIPDEVYESLERELSENE